MSERWLGIVVSSDSVVAVDCEVADDKTLTLMADNKWPLQQGDRAAAYAVIYDTIVDYIQENEISLVVFKESAVSLKGTKMGHLHAAELRGVTFSAAAKHARVKTLSKAHLSRSFGDRKVDQYIEDDHFWEKEIEGAFRKGSREAAFLLLASRKDK